MKKGFSVLYPKHEPNYHQQRRAEGKAEVHLLTVVSWSTSKGNLFLFSRNGGLLHRFA